MKLRTNPLAGLLVILLVAAGGCSLAWKDRPVPLAAESLVGVWRAETGGQISLTADGQAVSLSAGENVIADRLAERSGLVRMVGTWSLSGDRFELHFRDVPAFIADHAFRVDRITRDEVRFVSIESQTTPPGNELVWRRTAGSRAQPAGE